MSNTNTPKLKKLSVISLMPMLLAMIIDAFAFALVYPVMSAMFTNAHLSIVSADISVDLRHFYLSLGYLLFPLFMFLGATLMGDLSDFFGRKRMLLVCVAGMLLSFLLMGLGVTYLSLSFILVGRALNGLMAANQPIAQAVVAERSTSQTKARNMKLISITITVGNIIGPLIGGITSDHQLWFGFNYAMPFYISVVLCLLTFLWLAFGFHEKAIKRQKKQIILSRFITIFVQAFRRPDVRLITFAALSMQLGFSIFYQLIIILFQQQYHYFAWQVGSFNAFVGVSYIIGMSWLYQVMIKKFGVKQTATIGFVIAGLALLLVSRSYSPWLIWLFTIPIAVFYIMGYTLLLTLFSDAVKSYEQGWVMGVSTSMMACAWALSGLTPNFITTIGIRWLIVIGAIFMLMAALAVYKHPVCKR